METKKLKSFMTMKEKIVNATINSRATPEERESIVSFIKGLEKGLMIEKTCYENSKSLLDKIRVIHDSVLLIQQNAKTILEAWAKVKDDPTFRPENFPGGIENMNKSLFYPMENFKDVMPSIAKVFNCDVEGFLAPYIQNMRDLSDAIFLFKKDIEIDDLIIELGKTEDSRRKPILRKIFRAYKEYIGLAPGILHTEFKSPNVPKEETDMFFKLIKTNVDNAKIIVEGLRKVI